MRLQSWYAQNPGTTRTRSARIRRQVQSTRISRRCIEKRCATFGYTRRASQRLHSKQKSAPNTKRRITRIRVIIGPRDLVGRPPLTLGTKASFQCDDVTLLTNHHLRVISWRADNICPKLQEYSLAMRMVPADMRARRFLADSIRRRASPVDSSCPRIRLHRQD